MKNTDPFGPSLVGHYLANGGTPNDRTLMLLAEADRGRAQRATTNATAPQKRGWIARLFLRRNA